MSRKIQKADWKSKACDICGEESNLIPLGTRTCVQPTRGDLFEFLHDDTLCGNCGFVFSGKIPPVHFLNEFYRQAYTLQSDIQVIPPDFNPQSRLAVIREFLPSGSSIFEIGAATGEFVRILNSESYKAEGIDPLARTSDQVEQMALTSPGTDRQNSFDAAVSFFVLEHITEPRPWLDAVKQYLNPGGLLITEVPNFATHPVESLFPEHFLHFTPFHLQLLLENCGFETVKSISEQSRSFGFIMVSKLREPGDSPARPSLDSIPAEERSKQVENSRRIYSEAISKIETEQKRLTALAGHLESLSADRGTKDTSIYIWPANPVARDLAGRLAESFDVFPVDSSSTKIGSIYPGFKEPVRDPEKLDKSAPGHRIFVLCSPSWNRQIEESLLGLDLENISIIDGIRWQP